MNKIVSYIVLGSVLLSGCATLSETAKVFWGTSIKALEESRAEAERQTFACTFDDCFDEVLKLQRGEDAGLARAEVFDVFLDNRLKGYLVVMGIAGNVNTTEVGIFFSSRGYASTVIEIASLSSSAKRKVAEAVFHHLERQFGTGEHEKNE